MKKKSSFAVMLVLVGAALFGSARQADAVTCWQNYQACLSTCATGDTVCRQSCWEWYNACRFY